MAGFARPGLPSMSAIDLLAIKAHCRDILAEKDSLYLPVVPTGRFHVIVP